MKQSRFRKFLFFLLAVSVIFAAAAWLVPYDWNPDPGARFKISATQLKRDRSNYWLSIHLKKAGKADHDLLKPVRLVTASGILEPADTTFAGDQAAGMNEIWFKFWLDPEDLQGSISLKMDDGLLKVKSSAGIPAIMDGMMRTFTNHRW